jgi:hypothetical protein
VKPEAEEEWGKKEKTISLSPHALAHEGLPPTAQHSLIYEARHPGQRD